MGKRTRKRKYWYGLENGRVQVQTKEKTVTEQASEILNELSRSREARRLNGARTQRSKLLRQTEAVKLIEQQVLFFAPFVKDTPIYKRVKLREEFRRKHGREPAKREKAW